jgi:hypothetical protein
VEESFVALNADLKGDNYSQKESCGTQIFALFKFHAFFKGSGNNPGRILAYI